MKPVPTVQPLLKQWLLLLALLAAGVCAAVLSQAFWREDLLLYDAGLAYGPAPADVLIVAIDDASLKQIGRWPWRRAVHAALLERLRAAGARAVALDVLLTEPADDPQDDQRLAAAMRAGPPTVLPLVADWQRADRSPREILPVEPLRSSAAALAHAHLEIDRDGIARSVFLREGPDRATRPHLALALLQAAGLWRDGPLPGARAPASATDGAWARDFQVLIPFLGPPGHFQRVSYIEVLSGELPANVLRGKLVLVGATAQGLTDSFPTPRSGEGVPMPGVEISANVLAALRSQRAVHSLPAALNVTLSLLPLALAFAGFLRLSPRHSLLLVIALAAASLAVSLLALRFAYAWWPPAAALTALILAYPLWSWRRLEATQAYLDEELAQFDREPLPIAPARRSAGLALTDALQGRIERARDATARLRHLRRLLGGTIESLPDATLLVDREGRIDLANRQAAALFGAAGGQALRGASLRELLDPLLAGRDTNFDALALQAPSSIEFRDARGRDLMLRLSPFHDAGGARAGSVLDIADVTALKSAEHERDDLIRFLSHDLRSPSSSLLALAQLLREPDRRIEPAQAAERIESLAGRTLALAEGFISLARARYLSVERFQPMDLKDALQDALDEAWASATARRIEVRSAAPPDPAPLEGDRETLARAIINLLSNAIKHSPAGGVVNVELARNAQRWELHVRDQGPGIAAERQSLLFQRFQRGLSAAKADPGGVGLGLAFVRVVAQKHGGDVRVESAAGQGATFIVSLPVASGP